MTRFGRDLTASLSYPPRSVFQLKPKLPNPSGYLYDAPNASILSHLTTFSFNEAVESRTLPKINTKKHHYTAKKSKYTSNCFNFAHNWCGGNLVVNFTTQCEQLSKNHTFTPKLWKNFCLKPLYSLRDVENLYISTDFYRQNSGRGLQGEAAELSGLSSAVHSFNPSSVWSL